VVEKLSLYRANLHFAPPKARLVAIPWRLDGPLHKVSTSKHHSPPKGSKMNVLKNFEALFAVTLGLACAATYSLDDAETTQAHASSGRQRQAHDRRTEKTIADRRKQNRVGGRFHRSEQNLSARKHFACTHSSPAA
jgi:hypothetical protein